MAEGHIPKNTQQANHKLEENIRKKQHKAKARSLIKQECGRRPQSKKYPAGNYKLEETTRKKHKAQTRSLIKKEWGRRPHSKKHPAGRS